jgi:hypothetical protein
MTVFSIASATRSKTCSASSRIGGVSIYALVEIGIIDLVRQPSASTKGKLLLPENAETLRKLVFGRKP